MRHRRYVLTGGGTGGHVTPAIALANEMRDRDPDTEFLYVGTRAGKEAEIVPKYGFPLVLVHSHQWTFRRPFDTARFVVRLGLGLLKGTAILLRFRPDAVIGTGGYVAAPIVFANLILRTLRLSKARTIIHEQNLTPGRLNALVGRVADLVLVSFAATRRYFPRAAYVGYPVRREIAPKERAEAKRRLGIPADTQVVFAFGGSMGARTINRAIIDALPHLAARPNLRVIHGTGRALTSYDPSSDCRERLAHVGLSTSKLDGWYESHEFIDRMADYYGAADLVVARAGAGSLAELCAAGRPSLLIPKANLPGDHQVLNALELVNAGAARIIYEDVRALNGDTEESVDGALLAGRITELLDDPRALDEMAKKAASLATPEALTMSVDLVERVVREGSIGPHLAGIPARNPSVGAYGELAQLCGEALRAAAERHVAEAERKLSTPSSCRRHREDKLIAAMVHDPVFKYLRYRAAGCLASPAWRIKNAGVKLVGVLRQREKLPILLSIVTDRTPAPVLHRLLGGDYVQNGFLRRNSMMSIARLGVYSPSVREALIAGMTDPYFEVRSQSAHAAAELADLIDPDDGLEAALLKVTRDPSFEVVIEAVRALGLLGRSSAAVPRLHELSASENWRIRQAVVNAYGALLARGEPVDRELARRDLDEMMITSTGFAPTFALKTAIGKLGEALAAADAARKTNPAHSPVGSGEDV